MLFRVWFYACKLFLLGMLLCLLRAFLPSLPWAVGATGLALVVPIGLIGAALSVPLLFGWRTACPFCGTRTPWLVHDKTLVMDCPRCGLVGGHPIRDWNVKAGLVLSDPSTTQSAAERSKHVAVPMKPRSRFLVILFVMGVLCGGLILSAIGCALRSEIVVGSGFLWNGVLLLVLAVLAARGDKINSNWGTAVKRTNPFGFWLSVGTLCLGGAMFAYGGLMIAIGRLAFFKN